MLFFYVAWFVIDFHCLCACSIDCFSGALAFCCWGYCFNFVDASQYAFELLNCVWFIVALLSHESLLLFSASIIWFVAFADELIGETSSVML